MKEVKEGSEGRKEEEGRKEIKALSRSYPLPVHGRKEGRKEVKEGSEGRKEGKEVKEVKEGRK